MSLRTLIQNIFSVAHKDDIAEVMRQQQVTLQQQQATLQQLASAITAKGDLAMPSQPGSTEADYLKQQLAQIKSRFLDAQNQISCLQSQLADAKNQGVKDFFAKAEAEHKKLQARGKGRPTEEGTRSMIRIEPDVRERVALLAKVHSGTNLTKFLNAAAREKLKDIFSDPEYRALLFEEEE